MYSTTTLRFTDNSPTPTASPVAAVASSLLLTPAAVYVDPPAASIAGSPAAAVVDVAAGKIIE